MISDPKFNTAKDWFEKLRNNLVEIIQNIDENKFEVILVYFMKYSELLL